MDASVTEDRSLKVFIDSSGLPLRIFVDSLNGTSLVNHLKSYGARITPTAQSAQYIITDSKVFSDGIRYEINTEGKILDSSWIRKCIGERRLLLEDDNWGGCAIINPSSFVQASNAHGNHSADSQYLPPRVMRRSDPRPISSGTPSIPLFESNATTGLVTFPPSSHTSLNTPTLSRGNTVEPAFVARPQQDENQHYAPQITPTPNFMVPSFMQPGVAIPQSFPINPQSFQQMQIQNQIMFLALANKVMNLAALSQAQPQQPYPNSVFPTHNILASAPAPVSTINAEEHTISNDWPSLNSSRSSSGEPSRDAKGKQKATSPANSFSSVGSISEAQAPIFTRNGESVMFFVQIDLSQRHDLVSKIKKNGGIISIEQDIADYSVLSSKSRCFAPLFRTATTSNTPAVISSFVHDCIRKGKILSHDPKYLVKAPITRKLGRQSSDDAESLKRMKVTFESQKEKTSQDTTFSKKKPKVEVERQGKPSQDIASNKKLKAEAALGIHGKGRELVKKRPISGIDKSSESSRRISSPPPPPESAKVQSSAGRYSYSPLEREYVETYVRILFERDYLISNMKIAKKLHEKMPHHTARSWNTMLSGQLCEVLERARKLAGIAYRKNVYSEKHGQEQLHSGADGKSVKRQKLSEDSPKERDIQFIAQFFADGEANDVDDDDENRAALWERLYQRGNWKTAISWEKFYGDNHVEVKRQFGEITGQET